MHASKKILALEKSTIHKKHPSFRGGDTIRVHARIKEGSKERVQAIEGVAIRISGKGASRTFTVRKISKSIGVELIYPLYSPHITKIEIISRGKVRQGRLYYLRKLSGRAAKMKNREVHRSRLNSNQTKETKETSQNISINGKLKEDAPQTRDIGREEKVETPE